jgi:thiamine-phosphate pyrophosphorylase
MLCGKWPGKRFAMATPTCRLFLVTPGSLDEALARDCLAAAIEAGDVASLLIAEGPSQAALAEALTGPAQARGVAVLIEADVELARKVKADGVMTGGGLQDYSTARAALGPDAIVGARCASRHEALEAAEAGADFVLLDDPGLVTWWTEISVVPCVASAGGDNAEFRVPPMRMWESVELAKGAIRDAR